MRQDRPVLVTLITLSPNQLTVADVSGVGGVTSFDAALIAAYSAPPGSARRKLDIYTHQLWPVDRFCKYLW